MMIDENFIPAVKTCIEFEELEDGCILYDPDKGEVYSLNRTAACVWSCCDGNHSLKEIAHILKRYFNSENKPVLLDILKIINEFSKKELLTP